MPDKLTERIRAVAQLGRLTVTMLRASGVARSMRPFALATYLGERLRTKKNPSLVLRFHALNSPDKLALVDYQHGKDVRYTFRELDERVNRLAHGLASLGVRAGDRVALMMRNCHEYLEVQWAAARLGAIAVQIGYRLKPPEVAYILEHSAPAAFLFSSGEADVARAAQRAAGMPIEQNLVPLGQRYEELLARGKPTPPRLETDVEPGIMIYTSGTTGRPKGASRQMKQSLHSAICDFFIQLGIRSDDRHLVVCPLYHSAAPVFCAFMFALGGTVILLDHFEPEAVLQVMDRERITSSFMVPTMLARLAALPDEVKKKYDLKAVRWLASGAAPLPTEVARRTEAMFGPTLYNFYGATETGIVTVAGPGEHTAHPGTIGRALAGNDIKLFGEDGSEVPIGDVGELYVKNSMLVQGYYRDDAGTKKAMRDGYFSVGDMARTDAQGFFYLADRKSDMVISGGVNIYPLEIEHRLHSHPAIIEAAVIGVPDDEWGEALKAFIVVRNGMTLSPDEVRAFCKEVLANFKTPKHIEFIDALPRNPTGKVLKRELRTR
jgi:fatty-acyl-CoA synthase